MDYVIVCPIHEVLLSEAADIPPMKCPKCIEDLNNKENAMNNNINTPIFHVMLLEYFEGTAMETINKAMSPFDPQNIMWTEIQGNDAMINQHKAEDFFGELSIFMGVRFINEPSLDVWQTMRATGTRVKEYYTFVVEEPMTSRAMLLGAVSKVVNIYPLHKDINDMNVDELIEREAMLFECGAEITSARSAYETEEEFQAELAPISAEMDAVRILIDHKTNINKKKENNMKKCCVITSKGACGTKFGINIVQVMVKGGQIIDPSCVKEGNMPGWYYQDVPTCASHRGSLSRGKMLDALIPNKAAQIVLPIEVPKVEVKTKFKCRGCDVGHNTPAEMRACLGIKKENKVSSKSGDWFLVNNNPVKKIRNPYQR